VYEPIESLDSLEARLTTFQQQYNEAVRGGAMDLVFFKVKQTKQVIQSMHPSINRLIDQSSCKL
jgi:hypothetical protein